uniref:Uncharacterized protein n=1 Tax=Euplotes harpa TaxID=151035 RepID=A0A7S3N4S5_9SPIT|mmetsp:Transcript_11077/g.12453  ORF Transcript_11077/g.12453 Transcript_11077/m.12453 type:complete len:133 (+) Transcript_11077:563-961(+)
MESFRNTTEKSLSEKRLSSVFKKSNSQEFTKGGKNIPYINRYDIRACVPCINKTSKPKERGSLSVQKIEKFDPKVEKELDESFKRIFEPNFMKERISKDILLDNYLFKRKKKETKKEADLNVLQLKTQHAEH